MAQETTFTTGQACGITGISLSSVQYYVRTYRDYFSPGAGQRKQGRRFAPEDISKLLLIRRMYFEGRKAEDIKAVLSGEQTTTTQEYTTLDIITLIEVARGYAETARKEAREAAYQRQEAGHINDAGKTHLDNFHDLIKAGKLQSLLDRIEKLEKEIRSMKINTEVQAEAHRTITKPKFKDLFRKDR